MNKRLTNFSWTILTITRPAEDLSGTFRGLPTRRFCIGLTLPPFASSSAFACCLGPEPRGRPTGRGVLDDASNVLVAGRPRFGRIDVCESGPQAGCTAS